MAGRRTGVLIHSRAPLRINDIGGWTDTWFAGSGRVVNLAVAPPVEVQLSLRPNPGRVRERAEVRAEDFGDVFRFDPDHPRSAPHPLLQFTLAAIPLSRRFCFTVRIQSPVPPGISTGTSASVAVALLGALDLASGGNRTPLEIASLAHRVETEMLHQQSGIQDQICAAHGGVSDIRLSRYPSARVGRVPVRPEVWEELDRRLLLVYLGRPHRSSVLHERVIKQLERGGRGLETLERLAGLAAAARETLVAGDLREYGRIMVSNNECQRTLFRELISAVADEVIRLARTWKAAGWKVNGAGGRGGSLTVLGPADDDLRLKLARDIVRLGRGIRLLPVRLSPRGLIAWRSSSG